MATDQRAALARITRFDQLIPYLRDEMGWPIGDEDFEELTFDYTADELGIDPKNAVDFKEIKRLRPLAVDQPWGIFFVEFQPKKLPVLALRRILGHFALKKRASASTADHPAWAADDLLFVSSYGEADERQISFAHFSSSQDGHASPTLKVLGWDNLNTALHLDSVAVKLIKYLAWPDDETDVEAWRTRWSSAFTLRNREVITTSRELSIRLAELARAIRDRTNSTLAIETEQGRLTKLMKAFRDALVHDLDRDGFADMYAQTIAYGLLSARIADPSKKTVDHFAGHLRTNPFLRELMETFLQVGGRVSETGQAGIDFDELGVGEVIELLDSANIEAVVADFGDRNPQEDPVIHFYELFLKEYDSKRRMQRGVFYTPRPVVSYIVNAVHDRLRTEFGLEDGLADTVTWAEMARRRKGLTIPDGMRPEQDFVQILDPACGTGTFLVEVVDVVHEVMLARWKAEGHGAREVEKLWNEYVPRYLLPRLYGFELLMAPYAIAHLKLGLKLLETGYRFESSERLRVYLTNSLEPAGDVGQMRLDALVAALAHEAEAVNEIKRQQKFTVVLGNPPYAGHSANNQLAWIVDKVYDYKRGYPELQKPGQAKWLQDDYVKFLRLSELTLESARIGVLGVITNHSFLDNPTFIGMRASLLRTFSRIEVINLNGNASERQFAPNGGRDENVFDIQQGVSISVGTRGGTGKPGITYADLFGSRSEKYALLAEGLRNAAFVHVSPQEPHLAFLPQGEVSRAEFDRGTPVPRLMNQNGDPAAGIVTTQDEFAISWTAEEAETKVERLLATRSEAEARTLFRLCSQAQWDYRRAKEELRDGSWRDDLCSVLYRPFDIRWTVFNRNVAVHRRERVMRHMLSGENLALVLVRNVPPGAVAPYALATRHVLVNTALRPAGSPSIDVLFPLYLLPDHAKGQGSSRAETGQMTPNLDPVLTGTLSQKFGLRYLGVGSEDLLKNVGADDIFRYVYATLYSSGFRSRYQRFLESEFPAIQWPQARELFVELSRLGAALVSMHLMESPSLNQPVTTYVGPERPDVGRVVWSSGSVWLDSSAAATNRPAKAGKIGFVGVSEAVWNYHIGGYQVCEKWLKDRKGRTLSDEEITHYQKIVVVLGETIRLTQQIDRVIEAYGGWPGAFEDAQAKPTLATVIPFRPRIIQPSQADRYVACAPLVPLNVAAGAFGDPQHIEEYDFEWVALDSDHRLRPGMFVARVVGKSMEPAIPDGSYCLFSAPVAGSRLGKTVLVQLRDGVDPETGERYTVKLYESQKDWEMEGLWQHQTITLRPNNPDFQPIVLTSAQEGDVKVIAELVEVLHDDA